jgi:chromate reductase, NAD(P)H dehydrogenase (quinone)
MKNKVRILGIVGSIRKNSYNKALMQAAIELKPENCEIEIFDIAAIPPFNQDLEATPPPIVRELKEKIKTSDALLIATPEYNYSIPGILKNAIDSASRPYGENVFDYKPVALMSASIGKLGGGRAQYHLRQSFVFLNMFPINYPEVMLPQAQQSVDENGRLDNEETRILIRKLLEELIRWTKRLRQKPSE